MIIKMFSTEKGIQLTDNDGKDLMTVLPNEIKNNIKEKREQQYKHSYDDIKEQIVLHDVISFDIFDTLITRRVPEPEMVFDLVGRFAEKNNICIPDFRRERIKAQLESGLNNANLSEIYDQLVSNTRITKEQAELLKREELKIERRVIMPRQDMVSLFYYALEAQKKVYLTTDMYLERRYLVSLLNSCKITGYYDILDSCEYRKLKLEGLFDELKAMNPEKKILHVGDNYINDCICAEIANIDCILIPKGKDIAEQERKFLPSQKNSIQDKILSGILLSHIYNSPFESRDNSEEQKYFNIGYRYIGPIMVSLVGWMVKNIPLNKYNGILLSARDGFLINKIFNILIKHKGISEQTEVHYFYISRKAAVAMHTDEESVINMLIQRTAPFYLPDRMLQDVFCLEKTKVSPYDFDKYGENRYQYVWDHYSQIKLNVYQRKNNFYRYLGKEGLQIGGRYLFYDFVSSGTVQRALSSLVPFQLDGFYYQFTGEKDFGGDLYSIFSKENIIINKNYKMMETMILSTEPSLWGYNNNGDIILSTEKRSDHLINRIKKVHQGALVFTNHFFDSFEINDALFSDEVILRLIQEISNTINETDDGNVLVDDWLMGESPDLLNAPERNI